MPNTYSHLTVRSGVRGLLAVSLMAASLGAMAAVTSIGSRAALGGTDNITWGQLGADGTVLGPTAITTFAAASASVGIGLGDIWRADEGGAMGFVGNFALNDALVGTFGSAGPLTVSFANPVARVGTQIQSNDWGSFTGRLEAFNAANVSLGVVSIGGTSAGLQNNSASFLGLGSNAVNISSVSFSITGTPTADFWINKVDLSNVVLSAPVPEPQSYALAAVGALLLLGVARRRRQQPGV